MDDITPDHLLHLECTAEKILDTDKKRFQELCKQPRGETSDDNQRILFATSSKASAANASPTPAETLRVTPIRWPETLSF
jgi:hypothetical protein